VADSNEKSSVIDPAKAPRARAEVSIAGYLTEVIAQSPLSQQEIAKSIGYEKSEIISMFNRGEARVPLEKVPSLAKVLNLDLAFLFRLALQQYWAGDQNVLDEVFGGVPTSAERRLIAIYREVVKDSDVQPNEALLTKISEWLRDMDSR